MVYKPLDVNRTGLYYVGRQQERFLSLYQLEDVELLDGTSTTFCKATNYIAIS